MLDTSQLPIEELESTIARLTQRKDIWLNVSIAERIGYLQQCVQGVYGVAEAWAMAACEAKGIDPASPLAGEEWLVGPVTTLSNLQRLIVMLEANGQPKPPGLRNHANGQSIAQVFPDQLKDRLMWVGFKGEVWLEPGKPAVQGLVYRQKPEKGALALVLGAGNISAIAPTDALHKLFAEDQVVLLKMNPINDYVGKFLEQAFAPLIAQGFLAVVYGGADVGQYLCQHEAIDTIHITGASQTHDAIVWGRTAAEQVDRKATGEPLLNKPITSELGCVTPVLVVPGQWSDADLRYQARQVASMVVHNASFNCVAAKVLVMARGWKQRETFLEQVHQQLATIPTRKAYYPGAKERYQKFLEQYPQAQSLGDRTAEVPWTVIPDVPPQKGEYALTTEAFCGVLAEVTLDAVDAPEFLAQAVPFANEIVWGNLSCMLLVDPTTQKQHRAALDAAIAELRYGAIGLNVWSGAIFSVPSMTWGAFPGNPLDDISSGRGVVHNTYLFEHPQKSVLYAPFRITPTPLWFAEHPNLQQVARQYAKFLANSSWQNFFKLVLAVLKG